MKLGLRGVGCLLFAFILPTEVFATNGLFLTGFGANHQAMGGVGIALPLDGISAFYNPALVRHLGKGAMHATVGAQLLSPKRRACTAAVPECAVSGATFFLLPHMGMGYKFNRKVSMGFTGIPVGGGNTRYSRDIFVDGGPPSTVGVDLKIMEMAPVLAYSVNKKLTIGVSPIFALAQFKAYGLATFVTEGITIDPANITNRGNDWSYGGGVRFGGFARVIKNVSLGAVYTSQIHMSGFDKYRGLFSPNGDFNIPSNFGVGIAVKAGEKWTVAFDVTRTLYSDNPAISTSINNTVGTTNPLSDGVARLGEVNGGGFGWEDQTVYKLGVSYDWDQKLRLMAGLNYGKSPIPDDDNLLVNTLAPAVTEWHASFGFNYKLSRSMKVAMAYMHAFANEQSNFDTGVFPISPGGGTTIEMVQNMLDVSLSLKF